MNKLTLGIAGALCIGGTAMATTIDFGSSWPAGTPGSGAYMSAPYDLVLSASDGGYGPEADIAALLNSVAGTSYVAADILKTDNPPRGDGSHTDQFYVGPGYDWLVVQYDGGEHAGSVVIHIDRNDAWVPFDSAELWGTGDKWAVSHFSVAGTSSRVPDGGMTAVLLGLGIAGLGAVRRKLS